MKPDAFAAVAFDFAKLGVALFVLPLLLVFD